MQRAMAHRSRRMTAATQPLACKICAADTEDFGNLRILDAFDARYRRCTRCGFVFVIEPTWLDRAYEAAIAQSDTGIVVRNLRLADTTAALIGLAFNDARRFLDFGGGAGLFVRLMRDRGYEFFLEDKYCENIFAGGFDARQGDRFDVVTCMEVIEHLVDPLPAFRELAELAPAIVFSTELLPAANPRPGAWWYYAPETGQHVSFYTVQSLTRIGEALGMRLATNGRNFHVLSRERVSMSAVRWAASRRKRAVANAYLRLAGRTRRSLTQSDAEVARAAR
jgi:SAM-dependent methyltransferase